MKTQCDLCGAVLNVPESTAGKKGRCPKCEQIFRVQPLEETCEDGLDLAGLAGVEAKAPSLIGQEGHCPSCGAAVEPGDRICIGCGTDLKTGRKRKTVVEQVRAENADPPEKKTPGTPGKPAKAPKGEAEAQGQKGEVRPVAVIVSAATASLLGVAAWILVATFTGYEFGFLALGIGFLAGQGAKGATNRPCFRVGLLAALIAVAGIFLATYGSFHGYLHLGNGKAALREDYEANRRGFEAIARGNVSYPEYDEEKALAEASFSDFWMRKEEDWAILLLFSGFGAAAAVRNGMGHNL
jgi:hypothetical protein